MSEREDPAIAGHAYMKEHQLSGEALRFDMRERAAALLETARAAAVGRAAETLVKDGPLRLTMLALKEGATINDHRAPGPVSIAVVSGKAEISVGDRTEALGEQETLVLGPNVVHAVHAPAGAVILLTIAMP